MAIPSPELRVERTEDGFLGPGSNIGQGGGRALHRPEGARTACTRLGLYSRKRIEGDGPLWSRWCSAS